MKDFEKLPSSQMSAGERKAELASVVAGALIRTFVSSEAILTAAQSDTKSNRGGSKVGGSDGECDRARDRDLDGDLSNDQSSSRA